MASLYPSMDYIPIGLSRAELGNSESKEATKIIRELCQNSYDAAVEINGGGGFQ